jgi:hypothetical protein
MSYSSMQLNQVHRQRGIQSHDAACHSTWLTHWACYVGLVCDKL